jgi:hypothetical protein
MSHTGVCTDQASWYVMKKLLSVLTDDYLSMPGNMKFINSNLKLDYWNFKVPLSNGGFFMSCRLEFNENWQAHQQNWAIQYENKFISDANKATEVIKLRTMSDKYSVSWEVSVPVKSEAEGSTERRQYISYLQLTPDKHINLLHTFRQRCTISLSKRDKFKGLWPKCRRKIQADDTNGRAV